MLPIRHSSIFRSRWVALLWAGGICWSAIAFVGDGPSADPVANAADNAASITDGDVSRLQALVAQLQH